MRHRAPLVLLVLAALAAGSGCDSDDKAPSTPPLTVAPRPEPPASVAEPGATVMLDRRPGEALGARLLARVALRDRPGGRTLKRVGRLTEFGSPRVLAVVDRRAGWLGVLSDRRRAAAWIRARDARLAREPYSIDADLSDREVVVRRRDRVMRRIEVAVGSTATPTPPGRYGVTDGIRFDERGAYGCCALALTGRQPNVPQGWTGGDRLAIHGTSNEATVGDAVSAGCLRAREADIRWLVRTIPLGTVVRVRA